MVPKVRLGRNLLEPTGFDDPFGHLEFWKTGSALKGGSCGDRVQNLDALRREVRGRRVTDRRGYVDSTRA